MAYQLTILTSCYVSMSLTFFFQAEDGIRGGHVTGVQTCALPIFLVNNYKSITAAENMKEGLEREDSSAMFSVAGHREKEIGRASCRERVQSTVYSVT